MDDVLLKNLAEEFNRQVAESSAPLHARIRELEQDNAKVQTELDEIKEKIIFFYKATVQPEQVEEGE